MNIHKALSQWADYEQEQYELSLIKQFFVPYQITGYRKVGLDEAIGRDRITYKRVVADSIGEAVSTLHNMISVPHVIYTKGIISV